MILIGPKRGAGPPILITQKAQTAFPAEGDLSNGGSFVDQPLTHPLLKFHIGKIRNAGPPIIVWQGAQTAFPAEGDLSNGGSFVGQTLTHPMLKFEIGS